MENGNKNKWNQPWSMEEMIENAENWSLAGDVALLNAIRAYADNLLAKTLTISDNVDDMLNDLNEVGLKLDISQNEFQSLRNTQFIESRVYEDDETVHIKDTKEEEKELAEEEKEKMIRESILEGLCVMDKYFDKIEVSISDSEEDTEQDKSYVLQPKDLYANRPLPLIIGTEEWYKKWHVGLAESSSESDSDRISETYSDSDSEDALPKDLLKGSETSSELDFSSQASGSRPVANSTLNDSTKQPEIFDSDKSDESRSLPVKVPISSKNFADQLAEKLDNVISEQQDLSTVTNRRPIQPAQTNKFVGNLFSDEPPPLDDLEDTILPKDAQSGLFSGGQGLFDDNEDDSFWGQQNILPKIESDKERVVIKQETTTQSQNKNVSSLPKSSQVSKGLFDSDDSTDEDIFEANKKQFSRPPFLQPYKAPVPLFDEEPPKLENQEEPTKEPTGKKLVGEVPKQHQNVVKTEEVIKNERVQHASVGINSEENVQPDKLLLFHDNLENNEKNVISNKMRLFDGDVDDAIKTPRGKIDMGAKKISLFDDDDDIFKDDLFSNVTSKKSSLNLFDDIGEDAKDIPDTSINSNGTRNHRFSDLDTGMTADENNTRIKTNQKNPSRTKQVMSLFSDNDDDNIFQQNLIGSKEDSDYTRNVVNNDIAGGKNEEGSRNIDEVTKKLPERQVTGIEKKPRKSEIGKGLIENDNDDVQSDGLFKAVNVKTIPKEVDVTKSKLERTLTSDHAPAPPQLQVSNPTPGSINLFVCSPPPDDDEWDTKSDPFSDTEDQFSYRVNSNGGASSLFDNEPPSLGPNESSGIVRDQNGTRVDTDDSSFYPYASSSRRLSSDIFSEQQWQDSFFVTKSKAEPVDVTSHIYIIPEDKKDSNLNVTPSGKLEDLVDSKEQRDAKPEHFFTETESSDKLEESRDEEEKSSRQIDVDSKMENILGQLQNDLPKKASKTGSPGKLRHNLNINVGALLPHHPPPKLKNLSKSQSLDLPQEQDATPVSCSTPHVNFFTPHMLNQPHRLSDMNLEKAVSFEDALNNVEVLHSVTKDRVRIPIKRRPSTRRGRREAIRNSSKDVPVANEGNIKSTAVENKMEVNELTVKAESRKEDPKLTSKDTEPIFRSPNMSVRDPEVEDIFNNDTDDDDLFPVLSAGKNSKSDGDLFGPCDVKKPKQEYKAKNKLTVMKKSLFDDSSSDDDLFSASGNSGKRKEQPNPSASRKTQTPSVLRKLQNIETDDDPLSSLLK